MKSIIFLVAMIVGMTGSANCTEIQTTMTGVNGNTMITCVPNGSGEVEKAYLTLYVSDGQELNISRREMEISYDNIATYEFPGLHDAIEGKCKFVFSEGDETIIREEFSISMK
ncbi:MAG: hypothetical protein ABFQ82_04770 [Thermodesulfobacteriota bacterium]